MYEIIKMINSLLREQVFSNPFEYIMDNPLIAILLFSALGSVLLKKPSFEMCGVFYKKGSNKVLGSIGYMFFYCINIQVLVELCKWTQDMKIAIGLYMIFIIMMFAVLHRVKNKSIIGL